MKKIIVGMFLLTVHSVNVSAEVLPGYCSLSENTLATTELWKKSSECISEESIVQNAVTFIEKCGLQSVNAPEWRYDNDQLDLFFRFYPVSERYFLESSLLKQSLSEKLKNRFLESVNNERRPRIYLYEDFGASADFFEFLEFSCSGRVSYAQESREI